MFKSIRDKTRLLIAQIENISPNEIALYIKQATNSQLRVSTLFVVFEQLFRFKKTTVANMAHQKDTENNAFAFRVCNTVFNEIKILNQTQA